MTCGYCGSRNADGEHRCRRCGRRPGDTLNGDFALARTDGALAAAPEPLPIAEPAEDAPAPRHPGRPVQGTLFAARPVSKIIPIEAYSNARVEPKPAPRTPAEKKPPAERKPAARRSPRASELQESLDFLPAMPAKPRTLGTTVEAVIYCEAPVATTLHRALAAALDWSMVLIGYALFLLSYRMAGGEFIFTRTGALAFAAALPLVALTYGLFWTVAGTETPGMRWMQLRLITFDGFPPEPRQRVMRFAGSCLSLCTVIGLLWSLADEESLTWQDHISRTFPTPRVAESLILRRV